MSPESNITEPWRQPRRSNNRTAAVQCPTCGAEPGWRCVVSTGGAMAPQLPQGPDPQLPRPPGPTPILEREAN